MGWTSVPPVARPIADAATDAVAAAGERDAAAFDSAVTRLAGCDQAQAGLLLGTVVRQALEEAHPDGLGSDDVRDLLTAAVVAAREWQAGVDPNVPNANSSVAPMAYAAVTIRIMVLSACTPHLRAPYSH